VRNAGSIRNAGGDPALGKGSREMNYLSDLIWFVYDSLSRPDGEIPLEVIRLIQRFMRMLSTPPQEGPVMRLMPACDPRNYGSLVVTRESWLITPIVPIYGFKPLLRVRAIAGEKLCRWIEEKLKPCYRERMLVWSGFTSRQRMEQERSDEAGGDMDIKLGPAVWPIRIPGSRPSAAL
jgi:glutamate-ammonia-ligase adenylyltransferase